MIKYVCDRCGEPAKYKINIPRRVKYWAMHNGKKLSSFERIETKETHICYTCYNHIINMFDTYEGGECIDSVP